VKLTKSQEINLGSFGSAVHLVLVLIFTWLFISDSYSADIIRKYAISAMGLLSLGLIVKILVQRIRKKGQAFDWLFLSMYIFLLLLIFWNQFFLHTYNAVINKPHLGIFRPVFRNFYGPLYGRPMSIKNVNINIYDLGLIIVFLGVLIYLNRYSDGLDKIETKMIFLWGLAGVHIINVLLFSYKASGHLGLGNFATMYLDVGRFSSIKSMFQNYVQAMPTLSWRDAHYPPGLLTIFWVESKYFYRGSVQHILLLLSTFSLPFIYSLNRTIGLKQSSLFALVLFAFIPEVIIFASISMYPLFMILSLLMVLLFYKGVRQNIGYLLLSGAVFSIYTLIGFTSLPVVGMLFIALGIATFRKMVSVKKMFRYILWFTASPALIFTGIFLLTGFNIITCLTSAMALNKTGIPFKWPPFPQYILCSTGNILAYFFTIGLPILYLFIKGVASLIHSKYEWAVNFALGIAIILVISSFANIFFMETDRIWLVFTPFVALISGFGLKEIQKTNKDFLVFILLLLFAQTWLQQTLFVPWFLP